MDRPVVWALWRVRDERHKSLQVIADLAGMSKSRLSRIERGERSPTLQEVLALAHALQISVSDLTRAPVPAPANGHTDSTVESVQPITASCSRWPSTCMSVTRTWLGHAAAPADLRRRVVFLARRLAEEHGEVTTLAVAGFAVAGRLLTSGAFELGRAELDSLTLPPVTAASAGLVCALTTTHALAAVLEGRPGDAAAPMEMAAEVAERFGATGDTDSFGFVHAPADIGIERMWLALHAREPDQAVRVAESVHPESHPFRLGQAQYWLHYGCALAQLRGRHEDAVRALRTAEDIQPTKVRRDVMVRDTVAVLLRHSRRDAVGEELRGMARRVGLLG